MKKQSPLNLIVTVLLLMSHLVLAADNQPSVESFFKDPEIRSVVLSPKGHYVAILTKSPDDNNQVIAIRDTADLKKVIIPLVSKENEIYSVHWINENRIGITFKNARTRYGGNTDEMAMDRDGSNLIRLISGDFLHNQENTGSNIKDRTLTSEYGYFGSTHDNSDDIIVEKYIFNNVDMYAQTSHLFRLNTRTRKLTDLVEGKLPGNIYSWILDGNDEPRVVISMSKGKCISSYRAPDTVDWTEIGSFDCWQGKGFSPAFFDGVNGLFVTAPYKEHDALYRYDLKKMEMANEPFMSIDGFDFNGTPEIDAATKKILGFHFEGDAQSTAWLDPRFKEMQKKVDGILTQTANEITCGADCLNSPVVLVIARSDRQPTQYFIYTIASNMMIGLGGSHPGIKPEQMGTRDFYHYPARDGLSIPAYITRPTGKAAGPLPTVVLVHGGPNVRGSSWEWEDEAQFLASRGYVVIQPEFRGSTGFGFAHFKAGWQQWGRSMQDDLADAANWSIQKGWSDPKRIAIMGASYGGYATLMGLIKNPEIFRCGVEWAGVTDIDMMFTTAWDDATQEDLHYGMKVLIGDPMTNEAMFKENSPLVNAAKLTQPLLMAHGVEDVRVPMVHATAFRSAVSKNNKHVEWIVYGNEGHGWRHEDNRIDFWKRVETFLDKNL